MTITTSVNRAYCPGFYSSLAGDQILSAIILLMGERPVRLASVSDSRMVVYIA